MKKNRKILSLVLAVIMSAIMLVSASGLEIFIIASSEEYETYATSAKYLEILDILKGYDDGELHLEDPILRYQAALLFARVISGRTDDSAWGTGASDVYTDVPEYGPVMDYISGAGIIRGIGDGKFGYDAGIKYQDMCAMFVRVLGYETEEMAKTYPMSYIVEVERLGLALKNVLPSDYLNRGQVAQMIYTSLTTPVKGDGSKYIEEKFDVSDSMTFVITATENFTCNARGTKAEKGYFKAMSMDIGDEWVFPIDGEATASVTEADLIGRYIRVVFDDAEPTPAKLADEKMGVVHAEMIAPTVYENKGELSYVKFNKAGDALLLGNAKPIYAENILNVTFATLSETEGYVWEFINDHDANVRFANIKAVLEANTYFELEVYDLDKDGVYDIIYHTPYKFGQYANRQYGSDSYVMVGQYSATPVTNIADGSKINYVEKFLVTGTQAVPNSKYDPENTKVSVGEEGRYSLEARVTGESASSGDFVLYSYNVNSGEFCIRENIGTFQTGLLTGYNKKTKTVTVNDSVMSVGVPGAFTDANGLLAGTGAYASKEAMVARAIAEQEDGEDNVVFIEYDTKIVYLESYGAAAEPETYNYAVIDADASLEAALDEDEDAFDLIHDDASVTVKSVDFATGDLVDISVEKIYYLANGELTELDCSKIDFKNKVGVYGDRTVYSTLKNAGTLFLLKDKDEDGLYELHAYGTTAFTSVKGAKVKQLSGADITFNYGKSNKFIDASANGGILVERVTTSDSTVSIVIGADGYRVVKGSLGTNSDVHNELHLSTAARVLYASDSQFVVFDPVNKFAAGTGNIFGGHNDSIWNASADLTVDGEGINYYLFINYSELIESVVKQDADGVVTDKNGNLLYEHVYEDLYNLVTNKREDVTIVTTSPDPIAVNVVSSNEAVIRVDAENNKASFVTFETLFVDNDKFHNASFQTLRSADWVAVNISSKGNVAGRYFNYNSNDNALYETFKSLKYTFIDLDAGADVDPEQFSFDDSFLFYKESSNKGDYSVVELEDVSNSDTVITMKRNFYQGAYHGDQIANGEVTPNLTKGVIGKIYGLDFFAKNFLSDYLIPAVDEDGNTIWKYEGSMRVKVRYVSFAYYDEDNDSLEAVIVRIGTPDGIIAAGEGVPEELPTETESSEE